MRTFLISYIMLCYFFSPLIIVNSYEYMYILNAPLLEVYQSSSDIALIFIEI
jgi:hypothetical protein